MGLTIRVLHTCFPFYQIGDRVPSMGTRWIGCENVLNVKLQKIHLGDLTMPSSIALGMLQVLGCNL